MERTYIVLLSVLYSRSIIFGTSVHAVNFPSQESIPDPKAPAVLKRIMRSPAARLLVRQHLVDAMYL